MTQKKPLHNCYPAKETLEILKTCLKKIQGLRQQGLYAALNQGNRVSGDVYHTNILKHDDHYRHLPPLWDALAEVSRKRLKPEEVFARSQKLSQAYFDYIGLVLCRALDTYEFSMEANTFDWGSHKVSLHYDDSEWRLDTNKGEKPGIRFIPWTHYDFFPEIEQSENDTIICWPDMKEQRDNNALFSDNSLAVTPFDLYVVERIGLLIDQWLVSLLLDFVGEAKSFPSDAIKLLKSEAPGLINTQGEGQVGVLGVANRAQQNKLMEALRHAGDTNDETMNWFADRLEDNRKIAECPECANTNEQLDVTNFDLSCCGIRRSLSQKKYMQYSASNENAEMDFSSQGRMLLNKKLK